MSLVLHSPFIVSSDSLFLSAVNILLFTEILFQHLNFHGGAPRLPLQFLSAEGISGFHLLSGVERCHTSNDQLLCLSQVS